MATENSMGVMSHLDSFKQQHGEEAWKAEIKRLAKEGIRTSPKHEESWQKMTKGFAWLDWPSLREEALREVPATDPERLMADMLKKQMPGIKTQAQYNAVLAALDAVRLVLNALLTGDLVTAAKGREALETAFDTTTKTTELSRQLEDVPEAATSKSSEDFKNPPAQFHEYDHQRKLLTELANLTTLDELNAWYASSKDRRDKVVTQNMRNILMDAIRSKKASLS